MASTGKISLLFLGLLFALAVLTTSLEDPAPDVQDSAELNKVHTVKHYFGRNHHRCRKYGVSCKEPQGNDATSEEVENKQGVDATQEVENKPGVDAGEEGENKPGVDAEEKKAHVVKHYLGRNHHRCRKYGVSCKEPQGNDASSEEGENNQGNDASSQEGENKPGNDASSQEGENKPGVDAEEKPVEENKVHTVKHYFGRNHHRCRKYGVSCKEPQGNDASSEEGVNKPVHDASSEEGENKPGHDASQEGENKPGVDAEDKAVEDEKVHTVKHYFGRNHHRCRKYGVSCKEDNEAAEKVADKGVVNTDDQKGNN